MIRLALLLLTIAGTAAAQDYPALHDVTGVASDDSLNIRAQPSADAEVIGRLAHNADDIEVTGVDPSGLWARINVEEGVGWASTRFLAAVPDGTLPDVDKIACFGTEPFWDYSYEQNGPAVYRAVDGEDIVLLGGQISRENAAWRHFLALAGGPEEQGVLIIKAEECSDGMSDQVFGLSAKLAFTGKQTLLRTGCCSITAD